MKTVEGLNLPETQEEYVMCMLAGDFGEEFQYKLKEVYIKGNDQAAEILAEWLINQRLVEFGVTQNRKSGLTGIFISYKGRTLRIPEIHRNWFYMLACEAKTRIYDNYTDK